MIHFLLRINLHRHIKITPNPQFTLGLTLGVVYYMGLNKCAMTCIYQYSIMYNCFYCPKIPLCSAYSSLYWPCPPLTTTDITASTGLLFSQCHTVGISLHVACSDWFLLFSNMHVSSLHVFSWLDCSFPFNGE